MTDAMAEKECWRYGEYVTRLLGRADESHSRLVSSHGCDGFDRGTDTSQFPLRVNNVGEAGIDDASEIGHRV